MRIRGMTSFFASCLSVNIKNPEYDMLKIIRSINKQEKNYSKYLKSEEFQFIEVHHLCNEKL